MNKQELIERIKGLKYYNASKSPWVDRGLVLDLVEQLDKHEEGHADEAPRYVKNILARLRELPLHDREVWLKTIMGEFEQDFSRAKWREGYEQGKFEASMIPYEESQKVTVPQFVADWIEECKDDDFHLFGAMEGISSNQKKLDYWFREDDNMELFARAWLDGYEIEEEKRYTVKMKNLRALFCYLAYIPDEGYWSLMASGGESIIIKHTRKELEEAGFGDVFNSPLFEVEEVEE